MYLFLISYLAENLILMGTDRSADVAIVGAGIVGLAHAYMALRKGLSAVLFEREQFAIGASVRNFGLLWPIGQQSGEGFERAMKSRDHWQTIAQEAGIWLNENGSLHCAYHKDEWEVLQEFTAMYGDAGYDVELQLAPAISKNYSAVKSAGLKGALLSRTECTINSREAVRKIPLWLEEKYGLILRFGHVVTGIALPQIYTSREVWDVEKVIVCNGADFETLYPEVFDQQAIEKCKLQMMKAVSSVSGFSLGPSICGGLTLRHYAAFSKCPSLQKVDLRYDQKNADLKKYGVHVLVSQNNYGELIIGDSHDYSKTVEPFDKEHINQLILNYLNTFANLGTLTITERWQGVYPTLHDNLSMVIEPEPGVYLVNGLGGAGMTLSFGLAEEFFKRF